MLLSNVISYSIGEIFSNFMNLKVQRDISRWVRILKHAEEARNPPKTCRYFVFLENLFISGREPIRSKARRVETVTNSV